ncbi:MAG: PLP-dependent aspartate aminotransferase family protein [Methanothrix sp.]|nr:PLP-dependent aspartate aminotransferase family protein [Methanothrix sp.]
MSDLKNDQGFGTRCIHAGEGHNPFGAHATPIYQTSTFVFENAEQAASTFSGGPGYRYIRSPPNTPTHAALVEKICSLEGGDAGLAFSSGMAAETTLALSLLKAGDHLLSGDVIYGGTYGLFSFLLTRLGIEVSFVDTTDPRKVRAGLRENTRLVFLESPANPTMAICDIGRISELSHEAGAVAVVDNTFATPYFQRPLQLGADAVVESCTKYIGGHGDLLGGVAVASKELIKSMKRPALLTGGTMGTHEAWLCLRGLKTLHLRMARHAQNAMQLAQFLESHSQVERVNYPGLASHAQHGLAKRQMSGFGGMLSFELKGGLEAGRRLMNGLKLCSLAVSLGSVDTLIEHPASMTHAVVPREMRERLGISDGLVRVSVGIEDGVDIVADLEQGLD